MCNLINSKDKAQIEQNTKENNLIEKYSANQFKSEYGANKCVTEVSYVYDATSKVQELENRLKIGGGLVE